MSDGNHNNEYEATGLDYEITYSTGWDNTIFSRYPG